jgi:drug/metabolite transporter (DMT)-like permease
MSAAVGSSSLLIGVPTSIGAALLLSSGTILQALEARLVEQHHGLKMSMFARLFKRRRWVIGTVIGYLAFPLQLVALAHAPLIVVQPLHACGLLLLLAAGVRLLSERVHRPEVIGAIAIAAGIAVISWGAPRGADQPTSQIAFAMVALGLLALALAPYAIPAQRGRKALTLSAAIGFAAANMAVKGISDRLAVHDYPAAVGYLVLAAVGSLVGVLSQMTAFQRHRAVEVVQLTFSIPTFLPALLGLALLRERWVTAPAGGLPFALGIVVLLIGTAVVSRSSPVARLSKEAGMVEP